MSFDEAAWQIYKMRLMYREVSRACDGIEDWLEYEATVEDQDEIHQLMGLT